jgi:superfamily II DNA or RNA helicase
MYPLTRNIQNSQRVKQELIVKPIVHSDYEHKVKAFPVYKETNTLYYVPKFWGFEHFGPKDLMISQGNSVNITFNGNLKTYQESIIKTVLDHITKHTACVLSATTGLGKTVMGIAIACQLKAKTMIVVHKEFLVNQWKERIEQFVPGARIGIIQQNTIETDDQDFVIAMVQSLVSREYPKETFDPFQLCILDECHRFPSRSFSKALCMVQTKYMLGLSATPERIDGLTKILRWFLGDILRFESEKNHEIKQVSVKFIQARYTMIPELKLNYKGKVNLPDLINKLAIDNTRNIQIVEEIKSMVKNQRKILVLSDRRSHCETLQELIPKDIETGLYLGGFSKEKLDLANTKQVILATYSMCSEGYDCKELESLVLTTPRSNVVQIVGRVLRQANINPPLIIDIVDQLDGVHGQYFKRRSYYLKSNFKVL